MSHIESLLAMPWALKVGAVLVHFLWQGAAIALVLAAVLLMMRRRSPQARWLASCVALAALVAAPAVTACLEFLPGEAAMVPTDPALLAGTGVPVDPDLQLSAPPATADRPMTSRPTTLTNLPDRSRAASAAPVAAAAPWQDRAYGVLGPILPWIAPLWALGVIGLGLWHLGGWMQTLRLKQRMTLPVSDTIRTTIARLGLRLGVRRPVRTLESALARMPMVIGWLRPTILLPVATLARLTPAQLDAVLAHELAHIRRYDCLVRLVQVVAETLLFYHPAVWWISGRIRTESEFCSDELAAAACGNRREYALAMASLAEMQSVTPRLAAAATGGQLLARIRRLIGLPDTDHGLHPGWLAGMLAMITLTVTGLTLLGPAMAAQNATPAVAEPIKAPAEPAKAATDVSTKDTAVESAPASAIQLAAAEKIKATEPWKSVEPGLEPGLLASLWPFKTADEKVPDDAAWGEPAENVQLYVRALKNSLLPGGMPRLDVTLRNRGTQLFTFLTNITRVEYEIDGAWFTCPSDLRDVRGGGGNRVNLRPGEVSSVTDIGPEVPDYFCVNLKTGEPLRQLAAGKHTVRVAMFGERTQREVGQPFAPPLRVVSNPVEVEIPQPVALTKTGTGILIVSASTTFPEKKMKAAYAAIDEQYRPLPAEDLQKDMGGKEWAEIPIAKGWPIALPGSVRGTPVVADLNGDGKLAVIVTSMHSANRGPAKVVHPRPTLAGLIYAFHADGQPVAGWPAVILDDAGRRRAQVEMNGYSEDWASSPSVADLDGSGRQQVVVASCQAKHRPVWIISGDGKKRTFEDRPMQMDPWSSVPLADIDGDGVLDIVGGGTLTSVKGGPVPGWPYDRMLMRGFAPCIGDAAGDGTMKIYYPTYADEQQIKGLDRAGTPLAGWPQQVARQCLFAPVMGDVDGDGKMEICAADQGGHILLWTWDGKPLPSTHAVGDCTSVFKEGISASGASPTLADLDGDGKAEIIVYDAGTKSIKAWHGDGTGFAKEDGTIAQIPDAQCSGGVTVADLGSDGGMDFFVGTYWVHMNKDKSTTVTPMVPGIHMTSTQCTIADLDHDGKAEIVFGLWDGRIFVYRTEKPYDAAKVQWPTAQGNFRHTGVWTPPGKK
jgi:beta-lactamase regulating signal transducer with metallopeptidase domain